MICNEQIKILKNKLNIDFIDKLKNLNKLPIKVNKIEILQLNITKKCNLSCKHCHLNAGPDRNEIMPKKLLEKCLITAKDNNISTIDITGGAPELHPALEWFILEASKLNKKIIIRTNLVILKNDNYKKFIDIYACNNIEIFTSLPDLNEDKSNRQRGLDFFRSFIDIMQMLNKKGYGQNNSSLKINLVHNPVGAFLPANQFVLEKEFKKRLLEKHGIFFNNLYCITNMPLGRYLDFLIKNDNLTDYMNDLCLSFNPNTINNIMCKNTLNVSWDGKLYNCDFNQILSLPIDNNDNLNILDIDLKHLKDKEVIFNSHCYGCMQDMDHLVKEILIDRSSIFI